MKKWMKLAAVALFTASVACFSSAAPVTILNTEFTSPYADGDLAGQQAWQAVVGTLGDGTNAYTVTDASGTGYATTRWGSLLSVTNGNFVYLTNAIPNVKSNDLAGSLDFVVESTVNSLGGFDFLHIGLSSTKTNKLDPTAAEDAYLSLATSPGGDINVRWKDGDPSAGGVSTLIFQMPAEAMTWTVTSTNMTSPRLRLNWKIRKSNYLNTYLITASMTNLDASINQVSGIASAARPTAYNAGTNYFLMGQPAEAYSSNKFSTTEIWIDKMSITNTADAAAVLVPSDVSANALNALVKLTWPICYEAEKLDIYRSSISPTNGFIAVATNLSGGGISYNDSTVLNGVIYYYKVVWRANGSADVVSEVVDAEPNFDVTGVVIDTSFTSTNYVAGDLAGQKKWKAVKPSGKPAFKVDPTGNGYADTAPYSNNFNTVSGNQVYWNQIMSNSVGAAWSGTNVFSLKATTDTGLYRVETNIVGDVTNVASQAVANLGTVRVFEFGVSSDVNSTNLIPRAKDTLISVGTTGTGNLTVQLNGYNGSVNPILEVPQDALGWDPEWANFRTTNAPDFQTDPISLSWKIRKTPVANVYSATASLTVGTNSYTGTVQFTDETLTMPATYLADPPLVRFGMSHSSGSATNLANTMVNVVVDSLSVKHNYDEPIMYAPPHTLSGVIGNTNVALKWFGAPEAATNKFEVWRSTGYGKTNDGDFIKVFTYTTNSIFVVGSTEGPMLNGYTYTDYGLTNQLLYNYKIAAVYATGVTNFSEILPFRARDKVTQLAWNAVGQTAANVIFTRKAITNGLIVTGYGAVTNSPDGTNNAILYPGVAGYSNNATAVYGVWQVSGTNGTFGSGGLQNWRLQTGNYQFQASAASGTHSTNVASHLVYMKTTNSVNLTTGQYSWDLDMVGPIPVRAALRQSGTWYVTDQLYDGLSAINIADLKDPTNQWRELTIKQDALMNGTNNPIATNLALTAVDAVGILMDNGFGNCNYRPTLLRFSKVLTELPNYTITTTVINSNDTPGVSITPQDPVVKMGDHQAFVISGGTNNSYLPYRLLSLKTNNLPVGGITLDNNSTEVNYTWYDVTSNGTLTATFTNRLFNLSVTNGQLESSVYTTGVPSSGWYTNGQQVAIVASNAPFGLVFDRWTGNTPYLVEQTTSQTGTVVIGLNGQLKDISLTATYKLPYYNLTVSNGTGSATNLFAGSQIAICADAAPSGYVFDQWTGDTNALLSNVVCTTVLIPYADVNVTATYKLNEVTLTASAGSGGTIDPTTTNVTPGANASFTITASSYNRISTVNTNGANTGLTFNNDSTSFVYIWTNVQAAGTVTVAFVSQVTTGPAPVPYSWLAGYFTTNDYNACALADQDADGAKSWQEYIAGTVPTNKGSVFAAAQSNRNVVTWIPVTGRVYSVYWTTNLATKAFTNKQDNIVYPQGSYTNATPDARVNHYQVRVRLQ